MQSMMISAFSIADRPCLRPFAGGVAAMLTKTTKTA
jgi:hypothetical protein